MINAAGVDIGTTRGKVACLDSSGKPIPVSNARGDVFTPSVVHYSKDGTVRVGLDAIEQAALEPEGVIWYPKYKLGTTDNLVSNGLTITAEDAVHELVKTLIADLERFLGEEVREIVATCPADFDDGQKQALENAFERADVEVMLVFPEPTSAAYTYATDLQGGKFTILVYDFGGGTFDCSVVSLNGSVAQVRATEGVKKLGGNDINNSILKLVLDRVEQQCGVRPTPKDHPLLFHEFRTRIEQAKLSLNKQAKVPVIVSFDNHSIVIEVTQDDFHKILKPLVQQSLDCIDRVVKSANIATTDVDRLILVGGTSRLEFVQSSVADHTGLVPRFDIDPDKAVPFGAAQCAARELVDRGKTPGHNHKVIPIPDVTSKDVTGHSVGCGVIDISSPNHRMVNAVIIPKNTPIPCKRVDRFCLQHDDQQQAQVEILQGEDGADRDDCRFIGEVLLENLPREPKRTQRIQVEYFIDANGMVTATVTDVVSGKHATVSVDYKKGIKPKPKPQPFAA